MQNRHFNDMKKITEMNGMTEMTERKFRYSKETNASWKSRLYWAILLWRIDGLDFFLSLGGGKFGVLFINNN
jgi:hypothetical protein